MPQSQSDSYGHIRHRHQYATFRNPLVMSATHDLAMIDKCSPVNQSMEAVSARCQRSSLRTSRRSGEAYKPTFSIHSPLQLSAHPFPSTPHPHPHPPPDPTMPDEITYRGTNDQVRPPPISTPH
jgi:hypothetical protein